METVSNSGVPLLELKNVTRSHGVGERQFLAVREINLTVHDGEFLALVGPTGCGKSTLLRVICGLQQPSQGQVLYRGQPVVGVNPYATIVFQNFALFPWLTVQQNVEVALRARGVTKDVRAPRALELLDIVGLDGFESAYPGELSGGMKQKVSFARAMAVEPELLCLDEPFSTLDVLSAEALRSELLELWGNGKLGTRAILLVSHNIEEAVALADRVVVMDKAPGRVVADVSIKLPTPRKQKSAEFRAVVDKVYGVLAGQTQPEHVELGTAPGEPGKTRPLPHVTINSLIGLLEHLANLPNQRADIYHLAEELKLDSDDLLQLTDVAELLGFGTIYQGDIALTSLGETLAEAGIQARKEIFASRVKRVPLFKWVVGLLRQQENKELTWAALQEALEEEFPPAEAERQLETVVSWGRYAEFIAYDDSAGVLSLEPAVTTPVALEGGGVG